MVENRKKMYIFVNRNRRRTAQRKHSNTQNKDLMKKLLLAIGLVASGIAARAASPQIETICPDKDSLTIAFFTDIHITPGNPMDGAMRTAVEEVNSLPFDMVIISGDLCNMGSDAELENVRRIVDGFDKPLMVTAGNHETTWSESAFATFGRLFNPQGRVAMRAGNYLFVGYQAGPYMKMAEGTIRPEDILWVENTMRNARPTDRIVSVCHYPLNNDVSNRDQITALLRRYGVKMTLCGHYHQLRLNNYDSIPGIMGRALQMGGGKSPVTYGYNILKLKGDSIYMYEKLLGEEPVERFRCKQGWSEELGELPVDPPVPALDYRKTGAQLIKEDTASIFTGVAVNGSVIYYGNSIGYLHAYDTATGKTLWSHRFGNTVYSTPIYADGLVIVGSSDCAVAAFRASDGKPKWTIETETPVIGDGIVRDGVLYTGIGSGRFAAIDIRKGKIIWEASFGDGQAQGRPTLDGDRVLFGAWDTYLYCLDARTGAELWKWNNGGGNKLFSPGHVVPRVAAGKVFIVAPDRHFTAVDLETGRQIWRIQKHRVRETTGVSEDSTLIFGKTMDGGLLAVKSSPDGYTEQYLTDIGWGYDHNPCPITVSGGVIYAANRLGEVAALDEYSGELLWRAKFGNSATNKIVADDQGHIYITLIEGKIYRIR